ncbi:hypothetical protein BDB00DRAFT_791811 [Zychaea mexicana]|uniref:uncharacterized protein n=1 Tax=Zychaea mexicana TaxID=64656 RepID=UPI0022FDB988|nr:uncharacterized protein BDB00DRAFT_791811 [Zychaea mexicana]KAI9488559.1 hypothetical protein BDB00DRAFT_791811 [Zychaea mexicana]
MTDLRQNLCRICPVHSMIINPNDPIYDNKFTEEDLNDIHDFKAIEFDEPLPKELNEYLYSFKGKITEAKQPDLFWAWNTIQETVNLYNYNILADDFTEDDVEYRIWFFIAKCFSSTKIRASSVIILDSPKGSACRLTYSERVEFPTDPDVGCYVHLDDYHF